MLNTGARAMTLRHLFADLERTDQMIPNPARITLVLLRHLLRCTTQGVSRSGENRLIPNPARIIPL